MHISEICWKLVVWPVLLKMANSKGLCTNFKKHHRTTPFPYITLAPGITFPPVTTVTTTTTTSTTTIVTTTTTTPAPVTTTTVPPVTTTTPKFVPLPTVPTFPSSLPPFPTVSSLPSFPTLPTNRNCDAVPPTCPPTLVKQAEDYAELLKGLQRKRPKRQVLPNGCPCIDARTVVLDFILNAVRRGDIDLQ